MLPSHLLAPHLPLLSLVLDSSVQMTGINLVIMSKLNITLTGTKTWIELLVVTLMLLDKSASLVNFPKDWLLNFLVKNLFRILQELLRQDWLLKKSSSPLVAELLPEVLTLPPKKELLVRLSVTSLNALNQLNDTNFLQPLKILTHEYSALYEWISISWLVIY